MTTSRPSEKGNKRGRCHEQEFETKLFKFRVEWNRGSSEGEVQCRTTMRNVYFSFSLYVFCLFNLFLQVYSVHSYIEYTAYLYEQNVKALFLENYL